MGAPPKSTSAIRTAPAGLPVSVASTVIRTDEATWAGTGIRVVRGPTSASMPGPPSRLIRTRVIRSSDSGRSGPVSVRLTESTRRAGARMVSDCPTTGPAGAQAVSVRPSTACEARTVGRPKAREDEFARTGPYAPASTSRSRSDNRRPTRTVPESR